jgi:hypothetical protein
VLPCTFWTLGDDGVVACCWPAVGGGRSVLSPSGANVLERPHSTVVHVGLRITRDFYAVRDAAVNKVVRLNAHGAIAM